MRKRGRPKWQGAEPDTRPGNYYCTAIYDRRVAFLSGPFASHVEALADVPRTKRLALEYGDPKADFAAYGTAQVEGPPRRVAFPVIAVT